MEDRNKELAPGYNKSTKRLFNTKSLLKKEATPEDEYYVYMPQLRENQVIVPDTMNLTFTFKDGHTKCHFLNNLGKRLCEQLNVRVGGETVYDTIGHSIFEVYKDLWKSDEKRESMVENGIGNEKVKMI